MLLFGTNLFPPLVEELPFLVFKCLFFREKVKSFGELPSFITGPRNPCLPHCMDQLTAAIKDSCSRESVSAVPPQPSCTNNSLPVSSHSALHQVNITNGVHLHMWVKTVFLDGKNVGGINVVWDQCKILIFFS